MAQVILQEYPVLARQSVTTINYWVANSLTSLRWPVTGARSTHLRSWQAPRLLVAVDSGAGDKHRAGRSVMVIRFSSGIQLVYKPRPLGVTEHFQSLLGWLNGWGGPGFRVLKLLNQGEYGWVNCTR